jgi:Kef-type K+ transport system membrane component KefB
VSYHPVFWLFVAAVAGPLLGQIPIGLRVPVVVFEVVLGILIGPHVLNLAHFDAFLSSMHTFAMAATLFMAGMELDFSQIKGRPLTLAVGGWGVSVALGVAVVGIFHLIPAVHAPMMVTLALCTTGLGTLIPIFRDGGQLETKFGRLMIAAGTIGEVGPIVAMSLLLSQSYSTWQEMGFLVIFLVIVGVVAAVGAGARPPRILDFLSRQMHASSQLPVRIALLMLAALFVLAEEFGFESIFGAFAAGMIMGVATRGEGGKTMREKIDAVSFGWFYPFFFVGTGVKFDVTALFKDLTTMLLVPTFVILLLLIRGASAWLYRNEITRMERLSFALCSAVPSLSILVVITEIGLRSKSMSPDVAAALVGAGLLCILLFPTIGGALLARTTVPKAQMAPGPAQ